GQDCLVEPTNVEGLAHAMEECLDLSRQPETAHRCRAAAEAFSWSAIGPRFEEIFERLASREGRRESVA
ncbi:MAG: glycosyltransferase, partial [Bryobacteraceae bacterium]